MTTPNPSPITTAASDKEVSTPVIDPTTGKLCAKPGDEIDLTIEGIAYRGNGIARANGVVCFVPGTCKGEQVHAIVTDPRKSFWKCTASKIITPSPERLSIPNCRIANADGYIQIPGCVYDHMTHEAEVAYKNEQLRDFLKRQAGVPGEPLLLDPFISPKELGYRNKATLHSSRNAKGRPVLGYYGEDNVSIVDIPQCPLCADAINEQLSILRMDPEFWKFIGGCSEVTLRWSERSGVIISIYTNGHSRLGALPAVIEEVPIIGQMRVPALGFFQMNPGVAAGLVEEVAGIIDRERPRYFIDFYCGVGVFGLVAAQLGVPHVVGADTGTDVIRSAKANAKHHGLSDATQFESCDVTRIADATLSDFATDSSILLVDPPRAGLTPQVVQAIIDHPCKTFIYVSCSPDTMARDLKPILASGRYQLRYAKLFDMFPRTAHFETLAVLDSTAGA